MGSYTGSVGSSGNNLYSGVYPIGVSIPADEYPVKVEFMIQAGGAYFVNHDYTVDNTGTVSICDASGGNAIALDTFTLAGLKNTKNGLSSNKHKDANYSVGGGEVLAGATLAIKLDGEGRWCLRNWCQIKVETEKKTPDEPVNIPELFHELLPTVIDKDKYKGMARRAAWRIKVKGVDITDEIRDNLISLEITDNEEDQADDLQIQIADRDAVWLQKWLNDTIQAGARTKGLKFVVWIGISADDGTVNQQKTGTFMLDSVKHKGPPAVTTIKCISLDYSGGIRTEKRDKAWENYTMSGIAGEIAGKAGLQLMYLASKNPTYARKQQDQETDIYFLKRLCQDLALSLKITDKKMIIFEKSQYENRDKVDTIKFGNKKYISWDLSTTTGEISYDICTVKYTDPKTGKVVEGSYKSDEWADNEPTEDGGEARHQELVITDEKVSTADEAKALAEMRLKMNNLFEKAASFTLPGNPALMAGQTLELEKWGYWDGKYMISKCKHKISRSGYTTQLTLRKI
jgi:phage protein D